MYQPFALRLWGYTQCLLKTHNIDASAFVKNFLTKFANGNIGANAIRTGLVRSLAVAIMLAFSLVMAKLLGPTDYGIFAFTWSWLIVLATIATLGTDVLVVREISREEAGAAESQGVVRWSLRLILVMSAVVIAVALLLKGYFAKSVGSADDTVFYVMLAGIPLLASVKLVQGVLQAHGKSAASQLPQFVLVPLITMLVFAVGFSLEQRGVNAALISMLLAMVASILWGIGYYVREVESPVAPLATASSNDWLPGTAALGAVGIASMANEQIGVILLGSCGQPEAAGAFDIIRKMALVVAMGLMMVNVPLAPVIARKLESGETESLQRDVKSAVRFASLISLLIAALIVLLGKYALELLNPGYVEAYPALLILLIGQLINVAAGPVWLILNMAGMVRYAALGLVVGATVNILVSLLLIPDYGITGVAIGAVTGTIVWNLIQLYFVRRKLGINAGVF